MARKARGLLAIVGCVSGAVACNQVLGVGEGQPLDCATVEDCAAKAPVCHTATACVQGVCVVEDTPEGTPIAEQTRPAQAIAVGGGYTCALLNDGSVKCWGNNHVGQLGQGDTDKRDDEPNEMGDNLPTVKLYSDTW